MASGDIDWDINALRAPGDHDVTWADVGKDILSGTVGGIAQVLTGQPFDTTKVRLQSAPEGKYSGAIDCAKRLLAQDGVSGFYKGTLTPLIGVGACVSIQFAVNEKLKRHFEASNLANKVPDPSSLSYGQLYVAGVSAGVANSILCCPIEHVRIRLQATDDFKGPGDCIRSIVKKDGIPGLYRGMLPTMIREGQGMGTFFLLAEALVRWDMRHNHLARTEVPAWRVCLYGGLAGVGLWTTVYPVDVIKSRMQTDALDPAKRSYKGMLDCFSKTWKAGGTPALFKGCATAIVRAAPVNAATFVAFETTRKLLG